MKRRKVENDDIRAALREWTTARGLADKLQVSKPTALSYIDKVRRYLERKDLREGGRGPCAVAYRIK